MTERYPWHDLVEGEELEQGDIIESCPISVAAETETEDGRWKMQWEERDLVVLSQSCNLVKGREKLTRHESPGGRHSNDVLRIHLDRRNHRPLGGTRRQLR